MAYEFQWRARSSSVDETNHIYYPRLFDALDDGIEALLEETGYPLHRLIPQEQRALPIVTPRRTISTRLPSATRSPAPSFPRRASRPSSSTQRGRSTMRRSSTRPSFGCSSTWRPSRRDHSRRICDHNWPRSPECGSHRRAQGRRSARRRTASRGTRPHVSRVLAAHPGTPSSSPSYITERSQ